MTADFFLHPLRFPKNVDGPFYTLGKCDRICGAPTELSNWCGSCLACEAPETEAPDLLAPLGDSNRDTYFVRQPRSLEEIECACRAIEVCCVAALRYGGKDRTIIQRLHNNPEFCDYCIDRNGSLWLTVRKNGDLSHAAEKIIRREQRERKREMRKARAKWWQFWIR